MPQVSFGHDADGALLVLAGPIRYPQAKALRKFIDEVVLQTDSETMLIDLSKVEVLDSTGMGLLARIGRAWLERHGRRAVLIAPPVDIAPCLRSAAFDVVFVMLDRCPFELSVPLETIQLETAQVDSEVGHVMLDAHRALAALGGKNREAYADVIAALDAELKAPRAR